MSELGEVLRRARMDKGITLDEMTEATKIQKRYLIAIEEGNFDQLPGSFYSRAFIKNYADYVGLDSSELLNQYMKSAPRSEIDNFATLKRTRPAVKKEIRWDGWLSKLLLFSFIGLICIVIYVFLVQKDAGDQGETVSPNQLNNDIGVEGDTSNPDDTPDQSADESDEEEEKDEPAPTPTAPELKLLTQDQNVFTYEISNVDEVTIEIVANDRIWYEAFKLKEDGTQGEKISDALLQPGQTLNLSDPNGIYIWSYVFSVTDFKVNGQILDTSKMTVNTKTKIFIKKAATAE